VKTFIFVCLSTIFVLQTSSTQEPHAAKDSSQVSPRFNFITLAGQRISSSSLEGKVIILDFWSTDCNPCRKSMPQWEKLYKEYKSDPKVALFLVNSGWESIEKARAFASSKRSSFLFFSWGTEYDLPFAYDSASITLKAFNLDSNPSTVIIDTKSRIRVRHSGYIEKLYDFMSDQVQRCLAER